MSTISLVFRTPFKTLFEDQVDYLTVTTAASSIQVFPRHATMTDHIPYSVVKFVHKNIDYSFFVRSGIIQVNNDKNEIQLHCLFADELANTVHSTVSEHLEWIREQLKHGADWVKNIWSYEKAFLEKQWIAVTKQLQHLEKNT